jgi:hypothetical protein
MIVSAIKDNWAARITRPGRGALLWLLTLFLTLFFCGLSSTSFAEEPATTGPLTPTTTESDDRPALSKLLPPSVAESVDVNVWGWLSYLHSSEADYPSYWDADLAVDGTKRFGDRIAASADMHFIDANDHMRGWLEQAFVTTELSERSGTLLTVGKFNASFGVEPRNAWDRLGGTTSLLFGAEPQDLIGVMLTQPVGQTNLTVRPFIATGFEGSLNFDHSPLGGLKLEYRPRRELSFTVTDCIGNGFVVDNEYAQAYRARSSEYGAPSSGEYGAPTSGEYGASSSGAYAYSGYDYAVSNWTGPNLQANHGGMLQFLDANVTWQARPDLLLAAEGLLSTDGPSAGRIAWGGLLILANYDITDRWRVFSRWSFLNDAQGIVTGLEGRYYELSAGIGYQVIRGMELRGEYRHDFISIGGDVDSVSVHLTFAF